MADAEEELSLVEDEVNNESFWRALFNRKLNDGEKKQLISDLKSYPAIWATNQAFSRQEKTSAFEAISVKFSPTEEGLKKVIHSLRSSLIREVRRASDNEKFESCWKFFKPISYMKEDVVHSLQQEAAKEWSDEEINLLIGLYENHPVLWDHHSKEYRDRNLRKLAMDNIKESLSKRTEEEIKSQWHTRKTIHQREHKRQEGSKKSGTATSEVYKTKWQFFGPMSFILSHNEVDDSRSTWAEPELEVLPTPPGRKRRASRELQEDMKVELYKSCIEALKPSNNVEKGDKNNCLLTEEETFGKTVADTLARFAAPQANK